LRAALRHPLTALLILMTVLGVSWALLVPSWQSPDETWHFAYAQSLAERGALPGSARLPSFSADQVFASQAAGSGALAFSAAQARPDWSKRQFESYLARAAHPLSRSDGGGFNIESSNPPLIYLYDDIPYLLASAGTAFSQLYAMQIWNVTLLLATVIGAWLLIGEVVGKRRLLQLVGAAAVGLLPMQTFIGTSITPDSMIVPLWTFSLWLGVRVIKRGRQRDAMAMCALTAAAILTKATSYALVPPILLALGIGCRRGTEGELRVVARRLFASGAFLVLPVAGWLALARALHRPAVNVIPAAHAVHQPSYSVGGFLSYLAHFYFSGLPHPGDVFAYNVWLKGGWGVFGWEDVPLPSWDYHLGAAILALVAVGIVVVVVRLRDRLRLQMAGFFVLAVVSLLGLLHITEYRSIVNGDGRLLQGRYLLPLSGLLGIGVAVLIARVPRRWRPSISAAVLGGLLCLQLVALATIARTYYA
jgi:4-amino-4-deoxy-L-arabinose transferase-like glycosyltransferase